MDYLNIINTVGFPILASFALFWMVNNTLKDIKDLLQVLLQAINRMEAKL